MSRPSAEPIPTPRLWTRRSKRAAQTGESLLHLLGDRLSIANPVVVGSELLGTIEIGFTSDRFDAKIATLRWQRIREAFILTGEVALVSLLLASRITRPLRELAKAATTIGRGDLARRVREGHRDEVGDLAVALNQMVGNLAADRRSVQELNRSLKEKVEELETEVTERKYAEDAVGHLAFHDPLTELPNRMPFKDRLTLTLTQARHANHMLAVMFLDLDRFKTVNDAAGHAEGDRLLQLVGGRLRELLRKGDTVARIGGDEFTILLQNISGPDEAAEVAERILVAIRSRVNLGGHEFHISTSIGITMCPSDGDDA